MPASFVVGAKRVFDSTAPRFVVVAGNEPELRKRIIDDYKSRDKVQVDVVCGSGLRNDVADNAAFLPAIIPSYTKIVIVNGDKVENWDWLPVWFNKVKRMQIVVETADAKLARFLEKKANTRGLVIGCSAPTGAAGRTKMVALLKEWYGCTTTQLNLLLHRNNWNISECMQLLDKLALLNLPLSSDIVDSVGVVHDPYRKFIEHLTDGNTSEACTLIPNVHYNSVVPLVGEVSTWLNDLCKVKFAQTPMKTVYELTRETGLDKDRVETLQRQARRYDLRRINKLSLLLAGLGQDLARGHTDGILELMVSSW